MPGARVSLIRPRAFRVAKGELRIHDTSLASSSAAPIGDNSGMYSDASKARTLAPSTSPLAYAPLPLLRRALRAAGVGAPRHL